MNKIKIELVWIIGILLISILIGSQVFGFRTLFSWGIEINVHDTYFVLDSINSFLTLTFLFLFFVYLPRIVLQKFQKRFANFTFLMANGYLIFLMTFLITIVTLLSTTQMPTSGVSEAGWTVYPPLYSGPNVDELIDYTTSRQILIIIQAALIFLFGFVAYNSGQKGKIKTPKKRN